MLKRLSPHPHPRHPGMWITLIIRKLKNRRFSSYRAQVPWSDLVLCFQKLCSEARDG